MLRKERNQWIEGMLELVDLEKAAQCRIGGFSAGMIQRLGIAQALIQSLQVHILDEPTSAFDPDGRYEVIESIDSLKRGLSYFGRR